MNGYIITYSAKDHFFDDLTERKKALVSPAQLIKIIEGNFHDQFTTLWQATFVDVTEYRKMHDPATYTDFIRTR